MGYCASSNLDLVTWADLKNMCKKMECLIDEKIQSFNTEEVQAVKDKLHALERQIQAIETEQVTQNSRLDILEDSSANTEITTSEIIDMYEDH